MDEEWDTLDPRKIDEAVRKWRKRVESVWRTVRREYVHVKGARIGQNKGNEEGFSAAS